MRGEDVLNDVTVEDAHRVGLDSIVRVVGNGTNIGGTQLAYLSPAYLSFSFKEVVGVNFNEYLTNVRMEHAKALLASRQYRVYEVCEMVGYHDKKYFSDLFKRHTGVFPKEWR